MPGFSRRLFCAASAGVALAGPAAAAKAPKSGPPAAVNAGALLPLSGGVSLLGDECLRGVQLAVAAVNAAGGIAGRPIGLAIGDAYDQAQAHDAAETLIGTDHAGFIFGTADSDLSYPGSAAAELAQLPYIELTAPADGICARGFRFLIRTGLTTSMLATAATGLIATRFADRKVGLLFNTGATGGAIAAAALAIWKRAKTPPVLVIGYPPDALDLADATGRLRRAGVDLVLHAAGPADALLFFAALQDSGWMPQVIGCGGGYELRETAFALGPAFDGTIIAGAPFYPPRAQYIATGYEQRYGMKPRAADSLSAFVGAKLVLDVLNGSGGDPTGLLAALRRADIAAGTLANGWGAAFDATGQNTRSFAALQVWQRGSLTALAS